MSVVRLLLLGGLLAAAVPARGQVATPPRPDKYDATIRYRIPGDRDRRIVDFRALTKSLTDLGFVPADREDADQDILDPTAEFTRGTIPAAGAFRLPSVDFVQTVLLTPVGYTPPAGKPVQVSLTLPGGLGGGTQKLLHDQTVAHLGLLGFTEAVGYAHNDYSRVRGSLPADNLTVLLRDLRRQPSGWFAAAVPLDAVPVPFKNVLPVRLIEVLPDLPEVAATAPAPAFTKYTPDLRAYLDDPANATKPLRVEVILDRADIAADRDFRFRIRAAAANADGVSLDGIVSGVVGLRLAGVPDLEKVAKLDAVRAIRLPRVGGETTAASATGATAIATTLKASNVEALHAAGYRGQGVRVVVIATAFPGDVPKLLPANTQYLDLTAELSSDLQPAAFPAAPTNGTAVAQVVSAAAPAAELTLVRVDPAAFHQLFTVAKAVAGSREYSDGLQSRSGELVSAGDRLSTRRRAVIDEYRAAFSDLSDDDVPRIRREKAAAAAQSLLADEAAFKARSDRFAVLKAGLDRLNGAGVVVNTLTWEAGYPHDGLSELSQYLDAKYLSQPSLSAVRAGKVRQAPVWVQPASAASGQVWSGPFLDADGDGVMEFAPATDPLPKGTWTKQLNFLGFRVPDKEIVANLPAGYKLRVTVQWREPHDPDGFLPAEPAFPVNLKLLRQLDPAGEKLAADELAVAASSTGPATRLLKTAGAGVYEQTLEFTVPADGVYALRVEGRPSFATDFAALRGQIELRPRLVVEAADPASAGKGRVVFATFAAAKPGVGIPGDAASAITVGTPGSLDGFGPGVALKVKPELFAPAAITVGGQTVSGSGAAAGFAAGTAASLLSAGVKSRDIVLAVERDPGRALVVPLPVIRNLTPRKGSER